jgi:hypothetical protein
MDEKMVSVVELAGNLPAMPAALWSHRMVEQPLLKHTLHALKLTVVRLLSLVW